MLKSIIILDMPFIYKYPHIIQNIYQNVNVPKNQKILEQICLFIKFYFLQKKKKFEFSHIYKKK